MDINESLYVYERKAWRAWLKENHRNHKGLWLIYYTKKSGKPRISYNDAVEEALCFDWIDSTVKKVDEESFAQRFTPRNPKSGYSETNKERLRKLVRQGKVVKGVREKVLAVIADESYKIPADILSAIKADKVVWENFQAFSDSYKRIRIDYIDHARVRPDEFDKRLANFIRQTAKNKKFGHVIF